MFGCTLLVGMVIVVAVVIVKGGALVMTYREYREILVKAEGRPIEVHNYDADGPFDCYDEEGNFKVDILTFAVLDGSSTAIYSNIMQ